MAVNLIPQKYSSNAVHVNNSEGGGKRDLILSFTPAELGIKRGSSGRFPPEARFTELNAEKALFKFFGLNPDNPQDLQRIKARLQTDGKSPFAVLQTTNKYPARFNSNTGNYEAVFQIDNKTYQQLRGQIQAIKNEAISPDAKPLREPNPNDFYAQQIRKKIEAKLPPRLEIEGLNSEQKELITDLGQVGLSVIGIFDPTGIADGADAVISVGRGDYWGAGISAISIIPYLGDLAKIGKLPKLLKIVDNVVAMAKADAKFAKVVEPLLKGLKNALDNLPIHKLPGWAKNPVEALKTKIDDFFAVAKVALPKVTFNQIQLQKKFKHAGDFGITGNFNSANALKFQQAVETHIASPTAKVIQGTYRGNPVIHIFDQNTGINVMVEKTGEFISGWKLNAAQAKNVLTRGSL